MLRLPQKLLALLILPVMLLTFGWEGVAMVAIAVSPVLLAFLPRPDRGEAECRSEID